jgi:hypothetical protein
VNFVTTYICTYVYTQSAKRELEEELGIADADMFHMFDFLYEDDTTKVDALVPAYARPMAFFIVEIRGVILYCSKKKKKTKKNAILMGVVRPASHYVLTPYLDCRSGERRTGIISRAISRASVCNPRR